MSVTRMLSGWTSPSNGLVRTARAICSSVDGLTCRMGTAVAGVPMATGELMIGESATDAGDGEEDAVSASVGIAITAATAVAAKNSCGTVGRIIRATRPVRRGSDAGRITFRERMMVREYLMFGVRWAVGPLRCRAMEQLYPFWRT